MYEVIDAPGLWRESVVGTFETKGAAEDFLKGDGWFPDDVNGGDWWTKQGPTQVAGLIGVSVMLYRKLRKVDEEGN